MLRKSLNIYWKEHFTNNYMYGKLPLVSSKIKSRRMKLAGYYIMHHELSVHPLILWETIQGKANIGRRHLNYEDMLRKDTGIFEK